MVTSDGWGGRDHMRSDQQRYEHVRVVGLQME